MNILAVDTSANVASVALLCGGKLIPAEKLCRTVEYLFYFIHLYPFQFRSIAIDRLLSALVVKSIEIIRL